MKKRLFPVLIAIFMILSLISCKGSDESVATTTVSGTEISQSTEETTTPPESETVPNDETDEEYLSTPLFWKVTGNGYDGDFYLLGSIHAGDENTNKYPDEITDAFAECEYLAVESDMIAFEKDFSKILEMTQLFMYQDGSTIKDHIDPEIYETVRKKLVVTGNYSRTLDNFRPVYWATLMENIGISMSDYSPDYGVDRYFLNEAYDQEKTILEVEDAMEIYKAMVDLSENTQALMLASTAEDGYLTESAEATNQLYASWKSGGMTSEDLFVETSEEDMTEEEYAASEEYNNMLLTTRDKNMVETAVEYMESDKDVFYIVGLAHMLSDTGLLKNLADMGYTVTQVEYK